MFDSFSKIAPYLSDPFILVGFFLSLVFLLARTLLKSGIIPSVARTTGGQIIKLFFHYGFFFGLALLCLAYLYKYRELELNQTTVAEARNQYIYRDIAKQISIAAKEFTTSFPAKYALDGSVETVKARIKYPQIEGHPEKKIERKINDFLMNWFGVNADHHNENFDHAADFRIVSLESNTLVISYEARGAYVGAATGDTINKNLVLNLINGERFELKDLFRSSYQEPLYKLVKERAFCDQENTRPAGDTGPIRDDQEFFIKHGNLVLVYQRRKICYGADGPTFVTLEGNAIKPILNPNGPLGYLL